MKSIDQTWSHSVHVFLSLVRWQFWVILNTMLTKRCNEEWSIFKLELDECFTITIFWVEINLEYLESIVTNCCFNFDNTFSDLLCHLNLVSTVEIQWTNDIGRSVVHTIESLLDINASKWFNFEEDYLSVSFERHYDEVQI